MHWDWHDNLPIVLRCLGGFDREETFGFIVSLCDRGTQTKVDLEQRRLWLFGRHFDSCVWIKASRASS